MTMVFSPLSEMKIRLIGRICPDKWAFLCNPYNVDLSVNYIHGSIYMYVDEFTGLFNLATCKHE